jgi:pilus assembly protein CpaB
MKTARYAVLAIALVAGSLAWMLSRDVGGVGTTGDVVVEQTVAMQEVLVAAQDIKAGQSVSAGDLTWSSWPSDTAGPGLIIREDRPGAISELAGSVARGPFMSGEPLRESRLVQAGRGGYLAAILPPGMRAVSTRTSPQTGAGGFILPNDRVDVLLTRPDRTAAADPATEVYNRYISERILENIRVLAIDQTIEEQDGKSVVVGNVATLELTPDQVEILTRAQQQGDLSLALRSILDGSEETPAAATRQRGGSVNVVKFGTPSRVSTN